MILDYYQLPEVSSSDLGKLERLFYNRPDPALEQVFAFGSLVDALLTERKLLSFAALELRESSGKTIQFDYKTWQLAEKLADTLRRDSVISRLLDNSVGQYIFRRTLPFTYEGEDYKIRARCKFDLLSKPFGMGLDFKTTSCASEKEFISAISYFDYDKQAAWYMDLARIDRHWIVAGSKVNNKIFRFAVERGDETYTRGVAKYSRWAWRWNTLIEPFEQQLLKSAA